MDAQCGFLCSLLDNVFLGIMLITVCNLGLWSVFVVPFLGCWTEEICSLLASYLLEFIINKNSFFLFCLHMVMLFNSCNHFSL